MASSRTRSKAPKPRHIWQQPDWPRFVVDMAAIANGLEQARQEQGRLMGRVRSVGLESVPKMEGEVWQHEPLQRPA
jgi:hypothetical protein